MKRIAVYFLLALSVMIARETSLKNRPIVVKNKIPILSHRVNNPKNNDIRFVRINQSNQNRTGNYALACQNEDESYNINMENYIYSPVISLPAGNTVAGDFFVKGSFSDPDEFPDVDYWGVEVSPDAGDTWYFVSNPYGHQDSSNYVYSDAPDSWTSFNESYSTPISIDNYAGMDIQLRWYFHSDSDTPVGEGLFIDDITLTVDGVQVFIDDFEDGDMDGWVTVDATATLPMWHQSTVNAFEGQSWAMNDPEIGTNGGYLDHWYQTFDSPTVTLPSTGPVILSFQQNRNIETLGISGSYDGWDGTNIRISTDGGLTWSVLTNVSPSYNSTSMYSFGSEFGEGTGVPGWGGSSNGWQSVTVTIPENYYDQDVKIRWAFASDPAFSTPDDPSMFGWIIDNIDIAGVLTNDGENSEGWLAESQVFVGGNLWHLADLTIPPVIPMVQNINLEAGDGVINLAWDPIGGGGGGSEELAYDTDDGSGSAFQNGIFSASGIFVAGEYFNAPFGATTTVTTAKIFGYESNTETETTLYGYAAAGNIIDAVPTYSKSISLTVDSWNSIDLSADNWTFEGDFVLGFDVGAFSDTPGDTTYIYAPIDEAAVPSANSWVNFGSWSDWASVATTNNLGDGEWGIRAVINSEGSATAAYNVYRSAAGGDFNLMFNGIGLSSPDYTDNFVQNGTEYCYGITTVYGTDESDMAGPVCGTPSPQTIVEYAHDDGSSNGSFNATDGNYLAVKFTPNSYPVDLYSAKYFIDGSNSGIAFVNVWDDDGENDMPGTVLLSGVPVSLVPGWSVADLSAYGLSITEGSFYVGWMEMSTTPPIGLDMDSPTTHSYINSTLGSGSWQGLTELGLSDGAIMIRCDVDTVNATVAIDGSSASLPKTFALKQNYPNPFNPTTTIIFDIAQSGKASLKIYDLTGKEVLSLIDKNMDAGHYQFGLNASNLSSGMYIYRLTSFSNKGKLLFNQSRKLVLMK